MATKVYGNAGFNGVSPADGLDLTGDGTGGNCGATTVSKTSGSAKWKSLTTLGGSFVFRNINGAGQASIERLPFAATANVVSQYMDFICPALPTTSSNLTILTTRFATGAKVLVQINQNGKMAVYVNSTLAGTVFPKTGDPSPTAVLVPGSAYRVELRVDGSSSNATGTVAARLYNFGAAIGDFLGEVSASATTGVDAFTGGDVGIGQFTEARQLDASNIRYVDGVSAWGGPYVAAADPLAASLSVVPSEGTVPFVVTATATATGGTGSAKTYNFNWGDGTSTGVQSSNTSTHTYSVAGTFTVTVTVANS